jgi:F-type H+-transporting ATPase subunit delta
MPSDRSTRKKKVSAYARALLDGCSSDEQLFDVTGELVETVRAINESIDLRRIIQADSALSAEDRARLVEGVFEVSSPLITVLRIIAERSELDLIHRISDEFTFLAEDRLGAVIVDVTTAVPLDDGLRDSIKKKLAGDLASGVLLREKVDKSIVGGIILSTHGRRIDASMTSLLHQAKRVLSTLPIGGES